MLTKVEVTTAQGLLLVLPLMDVSQGFVIEDIQGLDPVKANMVSSSFAQIDGEQYQSSRREKRNVIIKMALEPDFATSSVQMLRNTLYSFFMPKSLVTLRFYSTDFPTVDIQARVESFVSPKFAQEPTATMSLLCFDPDFYVPTSTLINGSTVSTAVETLHTYPGTVETGFVYKLALNRSLSEFTMFNRTADNVQRSLLFQAPVALVSGDLLTISTISGNKFARLTRAGSDSSILYAISPQSSWINLYPGANNLRIFAGGAAIPYTIEYTTKYGGL